MTELDATEKDSIEDGSEVCFASLGELSML